MFYILLLKHFSQSHSIYPGMLSISLHAFVALPSSVSVCFATSRLSLSDCGSKGRLRFRPNQEDLSQKKAIRRKLIGTVLIHKWHFPVGSGLWVIIKTRAFCFCVIKRDESTSDLRHNETANTQNISSGFQLASPGHATVISRTDRYSRYTNRNWGLIQYTKLYVQCGANILEFSALKLIIDMWSFKLSCCLTLISTQ